jgi:hypothetical protein
MFADPQSVTVNAVAQSMPAVSRNQDSSIYQKDDATYKLTISHNYKAERSRFVVRLDATKTAADPLVSANNKIYSHTAYLVIDKPVVGYTNTETQLMTTGLIAWLSSGNILKVLGGET